MLTYGKYILIGLSYYKIIVEGYVTYQKGKYVYDTLTWIIPFNKEKIKDEEIQVVIVEEKDGFLVIN